MFFFFFLNQLKYALTRLFSSQQPYGHSTSTVGRKLENTVRYHHWDPDNGCRFTAITVRGPNGQRIFYHRVGSTNRRKYPYIGRCDRHRFRADSNTVPTKPRPINIPGRSFHILDHAKDDGNTAEPAVKFPPKSGLFGSLCSTCSKPVNPTYTFVRGKPPYLTSPIVNKQRTQTMITVYEPMLATRRYDT